MDDAGDQLSLRLGLIRWYVIKRGMSWLLSMEQASEHE